jgi:PAS domain-containing protein
VLENVAAGVVSIDAAGRIFTCNGAALQMLGQREDEVLGKTPREAWADPSARASPSWRSPPRRAAGTSCAWSPAANGRPSTSRSR